VRSIFQKNPSERIYYGKAATEYDNGRRTNPVTWADSIFLHKFLSEIPENSTLLDIPCGTGRTLENEMPSGLTYLGIDISDDMLSLAREKFSTSNLARFQIGNAKALALPDKSIDFLVSIKFIKWLRDDEEIIQVLKEFNRITRRRALINVKIRPDYVPLSLREIKDRMKDLRDLVKHKTKSRGLKKNNFEHMLELSNWQIEYCEVNEASNGFVMNYVLRPLDPGDANYESEN